MMISLCCLPIQSFGLTGPNSDAWAFAGESAVRPAGCHGICSRKLEKPILNLQASSRALSASASATDNRPEGITSTYSPGVVRIAGAGRYGNSGRSICWSSQFSGAGHFIPAACAADKYSWTVLGEMEKLRAMWCWRSPMEWSRRTSFNLCMVNLFCGTWESPLSVETRRHGCPAAPFPSHADQRSELPPEN